MLYFFLQFGRDSLKILITLDLFMGSMTVAVAAALSNLARTAIASVVAESTGIVATIVQAEM